MSKLDWIELAIDLFNKGGKKTYHVRDLAELAEQLGELPYGEDSETFAAKLTVKLNANCKIKNPQFSKVKNKKGAFQRGVFRMKRQQPIVFTSEQPKVSNQFTGAAGEYAVLSELLFRGFNSSKMTVDDGIDVVASKDEKYFHVQVKTANDRDGKYYATIKTSAFQHSSNVFYVVVLRTLAKVRYVNDFVIFPSGDIRRWISQGVLKDSSSISLRLVAEGHTLKLNDKIDVSVYRNDWDIIC